MEHPFANQSEVTTLDTASTEHVAGAQLSGASAYFVGKVAIPVPKEPVPIRPPVYSTQAIGEEGGVFPEPEIL